MDFSMLFRIYFELTYSIILHLFSLISMIITKFLQFKCKEFMLINCVDMSLVECWKHFKLVYCAWISASRSAFKPLTTPPRAALFLSSWALTGISRVPHGAASKRFLRIFFYVRQNSNGSVYFWSYWWGHQLVESYDALTSSNKPFFLNCF